MKVQETARKVTQSRSGKGVGSRGGSCALPSNSLLYLQRKPLEKIFFN